MICDQCETVAHCLKNGCVPKTTTKDEALKLALEALSEIDGSVKLYHRLGPDWTHKDGTEVFEVSVLLDRSELIGKAIIAIREALAEESSGTEQPAQPQQDTMTIQEVWEAAGGNPGIKATKQDVLDALKLLDEVCDEVDHTAQPQQEQQCKHKWKNVSSKRQTAFQCEHCGIYTFEQPAQPQQGPLFWYRPCKDGLYEGPHHNKSVGGKMMREENPDKWKPLYTSPPASKPLTGQQIRALWEQEAKPERSTAHFFTAFARAIEAAHGIEEKK